MTASVARKNTSVTLPSDLLEEAKQLGVNVSRACEQGLAKQIADARSETWLRENRHALESSNEWVKRNGLPLGEYILF